MSDRRVRPPDAFSGVLEGLISAGAFSSKYEVLAFAAALGYRAGAAAKLGKAGEGIRREQFEGAGLDFVWDVAAIAKSGDLLLAANERIDERIDIFEAFACGGLQLLQTECFEGGSDALEGLMRLVTRYALVDAEPSYADLF